MRSGCFHIVNNLSFVDADWLVVDGVDDFEFEIFGIILVCHEASDYALNKFFVDAAGGDMVDYCFHALHEAVGVPIVAVMHKKPNADCQRYPFIGILEIMSGA